MVQLFAMIVLCVTLTSTHSFARDGAISASKEATSVQLPRSMKIEAESAGVGGGWKAHPEAVALEAQNKIIKDYHASLLDTVYWALTAVAGIVVVLVGTNWLVNFKLNEQDKERMRREFEARMSEVQSSVEVRISAFKTQLQDSVRLQLDALSNRTDSEIQAQRLELRTDLQGLEARLASIVEAIAATERMLDLQRKSVSDVEATARQVEEHVWGLKGIPINVLLTQGQGLDAAMDADNKWRVESILHRMKDTLLGRGGAKPISQIVSSTQADLMESVKSATKLAPELADEVATLLAKLSEEV